MTLRFGLRVKIRKLCCDILFFNYWFWLVTRHLEKFIIISLLVVHTEIFIQIGHYGKPHSSLWRLWNLIFSCCHNCFWYIDCGNIGSNVGQLRWLLFLPIFGCQGVFCRFNIGSEHFFGLVFFPTYIHHPVYLGNLMLNVLNRLFLLFNLVCLKFGQSMMLSIRQNGLLTQIFYYFVSLFYD